MTDIVTLSTASWNQPVPAPDRELAIDALERGSVLLFPQLVFPIQPGEAQLLVPEVAGKTKNVSLNPSTGALRGTSVDAAALQQLHNMMSRFAASSRELLLNVVPRYEQGLVQARTSFRPAEIRGRKTSPRKDDTRLHVDSFPSSPSQGERILRVFANINPHGSTRNWRLGEPFEDVARRFLPSIAGPVWGSDRLLRLLRITKRRRTPYDHYMLQLHDRMKADSAYQSQVPQSAFDFPAGCTWMTFTDQVSHAAIGGQYALEQTYHLPVASMQYPSRAPLRVLETLLGRELT